MPLPDRVEAAYAAGRGMAERSTTEMAGTRVYFHPLKFKVSDSCLASIYMWVLHDVDGSSMNFS